MAKPAMQYRRTESADGGGRRGRCCLRAAAAARGMFVRFAVEKDTRLGWVSGGTVYDLTAATGARDLLTAFGLAAQAREGVVQWAARYVQGALAVGSYQELDRPPEAGTPHLLAPVVPLEVWAAGVTYARSRDARVEEAITKDVYTRVYEAERPELFLKATAPRVVGPNATLYLRSDSRWMVPEPELGLVLDGDGAILGFTAGNDLSSRDIEGENPLYLPQAKIFRGSCSLGPTVVPAESVADPYGLTICLRIFRQGEAVFQGAISTASLKRRYEELVAYLRRDNLLFPGTVLLTGTGIVPPDDFALAGGDLVEIEIDQVGVLRNPVVQL